MRNIIRTALLWLLFVNTATAADPVSVAEIAMENNLRHSVNALFYKHDMAEGTIASLLEQHPNYGLAHLLRGDWLMTQAHHEILWARPQALNKLRIAGLRHEAAQRLFYRPPPPGYRPAGILHLSKKQRHVLLLDAMRSRIYLFENRNGEPHLIADYYASIGVAGMGKSRQKDKKTPLGIYRTVDWYADKDVDELYGVGAYPLNYPNAWDKLHARQGSGIWIHGVPRSIHNRPPLASRGCVVVSNRVLSDLKKQIAQPALVILAERSGWLPPEDWRVMYEALRNELESWRRDWESLNVERYLSYYSPHYAEKGLNYTAMTKKVRRNALKKAWITVQMTELDLLIYPEKQNQILAIFDQDYRSNNYATKYRKQQMWREENGEMRIVFEGPW